MFFYAESTRKNTLLENIFSLRNIGNRKVLTILGVKIKGEIDEKP